MICTLVMLGNMWLPNCNVAHVEFVPQKTQDHFCKVAYYGQGGGLSARVKAKEECDEFARTANKEK